MPFPFIYIGELIINKPEDFDFKNYSHIIEKQFTEAKATFSKNKFNVVTLPLLNLNLRFTTELNDEHSTINAKYYLSLFELNLIFILLSVLSAFAYFTNHSTICFILIVLAVAYYWISLSIITTYIKAKLLQGMNATHFMEEDGLWIKQQQWMKNPNLCSACGETKNIYSQFCTNCGLLINNAKLKNADNSTSSTISNVIIHYKPKN